MRLAPASRALRRSSMTTSSLERMSWRPGVVRPRRTGRDEAVSEVILDPETASPHTSSMKSLRVSPSMAYLA